MCFWEYARSVRLLAVMVLLSLCCAGGLRQSEDRGLIVRRSSFADRPDMVLLDSGAGGHAVFNPRTGSIDMAWRGSVDRRGKVFDFSQETSRASAEDAKRDILVDRLAPEVIAQAIVLDQSAPRFEATFSLAGTADAWIWFEELGRTPVRVDLFDAKTQTNIGWFESACHATSETEWQWNLKRLPRTTGEVRAVITSIRMPKQVRALKILRENVAWTDEHGTPCSVRWRGFEHLDSSTTVLRFDLSLHDAQVHPVELVVREQEGALLFSFGNVPEWARYCGEPAGAFKLAVKP